MKIISPNAVLDMNIKISDVTQLVSISMHNPEKLCIEDKQTNHKTWTDSL